MGLDMYLSRKTYVQRWDHRPAEDQYEVIVRRGGKETPIKMERVTYVEEQLGYWRKANQIHNWFVQNIQGGKDECQTSYVPNEKLEELLAICKEAVEIVTEARKGTPTENEEQFEVDEETQKKLHSVLPTSAGFFFGGTNYDWWYHMSNVNTIKMIEEILKEDISEEIYYRASW